MNTKRNVYRCPNCGTIIIVESGWLTSFILSLLADEEIWDVATVEHLIRPLKKDVKLKQLYNRFGYLKRIGIIESVGYGKYKLKV